MLVRKAEYIKDYQLKVYFSDNTSRVIDLHRFLKNSKNHLINKYMDTDLFKQFRVEAGTICWGDNEFDLNPVNIYQGKYDLKTNIVDSVKRRKRTSAYKFLDKS